MGLEGELSGQEPAAGLQSESLLGQWRACPTGRLRSGSLACRGFRLRGTQAWWGGVLRARAAACRAQPCLLPV